MQVLRDCLLPSALVLEIASGAGEHAVWFGSALPTLTWRPTDQDPAALKSIAAGRDATGLANVLLPPEVWSRSAYSLLSLSRRTSVPEHQFVTPATTCPAVDSAAGFSLSPFRINCRSAEADMTRAS